MPVDAEALLVDSLRRSVALCTAIMERAAEGDPLGMLEEVGDFLSNLDAVDDDGLALYDRARAALSELVPGGADRLL